MFKNILIAIDGSELAAKGLSYGLQLAASLGAKATVMVATEIWSPLNVAYDAESGAINPTETYERIAADAARRVLATAESAAKEKGVAGEFVHVPDRHPADGILQTAKEKGCDLIVIASHGRRGVQKVLMGSVTTEVVTHSKIPVLVVR